MQDSLDALLFPEALTAEQRQALRKVLADDLALAEAYARWQAVRAAVRTDLDARVPDRRLLVLHALETSGRADMLTPPEHAELEAARAELVAAVQAHPALADVLHDVEACCADFEACWNEHFAAPAQGKKHATPHPNVRLANDRRVRRAAPVRTASRWGWRVMAPLAVALFVVTALLLFQRDNNQIILDVAEGQTQVVELADGSVVRLLGGSQLVYADPEEADAFERRVRLTGQAFFDVVSGEQGFSVETPTGVTTVLGTSFGISADEAEMRVVLANGKVAVASKSSPDQVVVLEPGQMSEVTRDAPPSTPTAVDLSEALDWTGLFVFRGTPLEEAAAHLGERYGVAVTVDAALAGEGVNGNFEQAQTLPQILETLAITLDAEVQTTADGGYRLTPGAGE